MDIADIEEVFFRAQDTIIPEIMLAIHMRLEFVGFALKALGIH